MKKTTFAVAVVMVCTLFLAAFAQEETEPKSPPTVPEILTRAGASYTAGRYSTCMAEIREANQVVMAERARLIRAAFPDAPAGLEKRSSEEPYGGTSATSPAAEIAASMIGLLVEQEYRGKTKSIRITLTADSPFLQKYGRAEALSKSLENDSRRIQYGKYRGTFADMGSGNLDLELFMETSMVRVASSGLTRDEVLAFFDQKAVDVIVAALAK